MRLSKTMMLCAATLVASAATRAQVVPPTNLRIGVVTPRAAASAGEQSALRGVRFGADEVRQTARLFGASVELFEAAGDGRERSAQAAANFLATRRGVQVLIGTSAGDAETLSKFAEARGLIFLNVASRSTSLRDACRPSSFHVEASDAMYANAQRFSSRSRAPSAPGSVGTPTGAVALWSSRLERFGASQLNDRFRAVTRLEMDGPAWAGWMAVKVAAEAALRVRAGDARRIRAYLESASTQFDGHKGWPLSFRLTDHQLRQPLYMVAAGRPSGADAGVRDVPDLRDVSLSPRRATAEELLDRLSAGAPRCRWSSR